jgi:hypothetical protein
MPHPPTRGVGSVWSERSFGISVASRQARPVASNTRKMDVEAIATTSATAIATDHVGIGKDIFD